MFLNGMAVFIGYYFSMHLNKEGMFKHNFLGITLKRRTLNIHKYLKKKKIKYVDF